MKSLTPALAEEFALMLLAGAPIPSACEYIIRWGFNITNPEDLAPFVEDAYRSWPEHPDVLAALKKHQGGVEWHKLTDQGRWEYALTKHYNEAATFLQMHNYVELNGQDRLKADTCRQILESKLAGTAGRTDPLLMFYQDFVSRRQQESSQDANPDSPPRPTHH